MKTIFSVLLLFFSGALYGQTLNRADFEQVLIPLLVSDPVDGANGTLWDTEFWLRNESDSSVIVAVGSPICTVGCEGESFATVGPRTSTRLHQEFNALPGGLAYFERAFDGDVFLSLRVTELTHHRSAGIPVVREEDYLCGEGEILDVPISDSSRVRLRIYGNGDELLRGLDVRLFDQSTDELVAEKHLQFAGLDIAAKDFPPLPDYAEIADVGTLIGASADEVIRIVVVPDDTDTKYWMLASTTSNVDGSMLISTPFRKPCSVSQ